jgi:hypothetical protein
VIRKQNLPFRPDWERVISAVVDHILARPDVDAGRVALLGVSLGGHLAPRAAAFEKRLAACIANGGVLDVCGPSVPRNMTREQYASFIRNNPGEVDAGMRKMAEKASRRAGARRMGNTPFMLPVRPNGSGSGSITILTPVVKQITCPTLIIDVEHEDSFRGEARKLYEALVCPKTWLFFTEEEGAGDHCQTGSPALAQQRIFDWLEETVP